MTKTNIQCRNCGQPIEMEVYSVIDVTKTPQAKAALLSGQLNTANCPNCGTENVVATPILYHDPTKELLVALVPMELNLPKDEQEKVVGDLMNQLPKDNFKGYMFNPKRALTVQGLTEQVLEADGITPEMMQQQRDRVQLAQQFVEAPDDAALMALIKEHDDQIDMQFLQTLTLLAQRMLEAGRQAEAQAVVNTQNIIAEHSSFGQELLRQQAQQQQTVEEVANAIEQLGENAKREDFLKLAIEYKDDEERLQALVGLARPAFDDEFFQEMTMYIGQAPADERDSLNELRATLTELTAMVDQQSQTAMQNAAGFLQALVNHPNPEEVIRANIEMIDDTFMSVLSANVQQAEQQSNIQLSTRLKELYNMIVSILQDSMQPELVFVNQLLSAEEDEAREMIRTQAAQFGVELLEVMDAVETVLQNRGDQEMLTRLQSLRAETQAVLDA